jgi:5-methylcytosine-specific restriction endonuclease McrA
MADTLLLNSDYRPHALISWKDAISMLVQGKVRVIEEYNDWQVRSPSITFKVPAVLLLIKYVGFRQEVSFNRVNIYARDEYKCQYCGLKAGKGAPLRISDLTFDHILPQSRGGKTNWHNIVAACQPCNTRKGDKTPKESNMPLLNKPYKPKALNNVEFTLSRSSVPDAWRDYLYWTQELEQG